MVSDCRAQGVGENASPTHGVLHLGIKCGLPQWQFDDMMWYALICYIWDTHPSISQVVPLPALEFLIWKCNRFTPYFNLIYSFRSCYIIRPVSKEFKRLWLQELTFQRILPCSLHHKAPGSGFLAAPPPETRTGRILIHIHWCQNDDVKRLWKAWQSVMRFNDVLMTFLFKAFCSKHIFLLLGSAPSHAGDSENFAFWHWSEPNPAQLRG